jgi:hypothetical protein
MAIVHLLFRNAIEAYNKAIYYFSLTSDFYFGEVF